jgi:predicted ATP-binding protein involved in virulence
MRIRRIEVVGLFDMFTHTIDFNLDERITIVHGVNGIGKTAILRLVDAVFNRQISVLKSIQYDSFQIDFEDNSYLSFVKSKPATKPEKNIFGFKTISTSNEDVLTFTWKPKGRKVIKDELASYLDARDLPFQLSSLERYIPGLRRISATQWQYLPTKEILGIEMILNRFGKLLPIHSSRKKYGFPEELEVFLGETDVRLIRAQRLLVLPEEVDDIRYKEDDRKTKVSEAVEKYSFQLRDKIKAILTEYSTLSQSLDRNFPQRLLGSYSNTGKSSQASKEDLLKRLENVEQKRNFLMNVGLYDVDKEKIVTPSLDNEDMIRVLNVYVEDTEKKLSIFDELANKISVLTEVINSRFQYKKMEIDKEKGFIFKSNNKNLLPTDLSSGEQHEIVLVYELLFQTGPDTLVLIDEPELSLHVGWQIKFLEDLRRIINLSRIDILIATHSPQIINNRWDLTVKLEGMEE